MNKCHNVAAVCLRVTAAVLLFILATVTVTELSPIYDFEKPSPLCGPDVYNPYAGTDSATVWKKANFHTHTRVKGPLNECELWPKDVETAFRKLGYDIVTFSNHNVLTDYPEDTLLRVPVYEHGYNLFKYHKLVFGARKVMLFDHLLPFLPSQRQWQLDLLRRDADFLQLNHPLRSWCTGDVMMEKLSGYSIMELDSGISTEQKYWDTALSAGHYSFGLANDDCHNTRSTGTIAVRCNFLDCPDETRQSIMDCLKRGAFWSMRMPICEDGDWKEKYRQNENLPTITNIGISGRDSIFISLDRPALRIDFIGQGHRTFKSFYGCTDASYIIGEDEAYIRIAAYFDDGCVIYTNPFARYDAAVSSTPMRESPHKVNLMLTVLYNLGLAAIFALMLWGIVILLSGCGKEGSCSSRSSRQTQ